MCLALLTTPALNLCNRSCDKTKEVIIQLYKYRHKFGLLKDKVQVLSVKVPLEDDELYTEETYTCE